MSEVFQPTPQALAMMHATDLSWLARPHQRVTVRHTAQPISNPQVVVDRYKKGHLLQPGETKQLDLLVETIARLRELRRPGRMINKIVQTGEIYEWKDVEAPMHPILIVDLPQP